MLKIGRVHIDYQKNPVGISEMPQFWLGDCKR